MDYFVVPRCIIILSVSISVSASLSPPVYSELDTNHRGQLMLSPSIRRSIRDDRAAAQWISLPTKKFVLRHTP